MSVRASTLLLLGLSYSLAGLAQGKPEWVSDVERIFKQQEPRWEVERLSSRETDPYHFSEDIVFRSGKLQAAVAIHVWRKLQDNQDTFKGQCVALSNTSRRKVRVKVALGEEGYMWKHPGSDAWPTLLFRQGHVQVTVFAPTVAVAKRFAARVFERIPPSNNGLNPAAGKPFGRNFPARRVNSGVGFLLSGRAVCRGQCSPPSGERLR